MLIIYPEKKYPEAAEFCKQFLKEKTRPRYVLGRNEYARSIADCVDITGFIDDFTSETLFLGKPIVKMGDIPKDSMVVSAVIFVVPVTAMGKLINLGLRCIDYFIFLKYSGLKLKEVEFLAEARQDIEKHKDKYQWLYNRLADEKSMHILEKLLNFRISSDLYYMKEFEYNLDGQYFENFLDLKQGEVFVDAGGFDGQTAISFIEKCPEYKSIHFFEPDPNNVIIAHDNLAKHDHIYFYNVGLAETKKTLRFKSGVGSASRVSETGDIGIRMDSIDNLIEEPITVLKMDIEGAEELALDGARSHIFKDHPKLAICCYHKFDDLWKIPQQVLAIREDYSIYLRHYTDGLHETVMYFMPKV